MKKIIILLAISFCLADTNIGWVDSQYIFNQLEETREAQVQIEKKQNKLEHKFMNISFSYFSPLGLGIAIVDVKIEFYASKSSPGSLPEVWKREICIKY